MRSSFGCSLNSFVARSGCRELICLCLFSVRHQSRTTQKKDESEGRMGEENSYTILSLFPWPNTCCVTIRYRSSSLLFSLASLHFTFPDVFTFLIPYVCVFPHFPLAICLSYLLYISFCLFMSSLYLLFSFGPCKECMCLSVSSNCCGASTHYVSV